MTIRPFALSRLSAIMDPAGKYRVVHLSRSWERSVNICIRKMYPYLSTYLPIYLPIYLSLDRDERGTELWMDGWMEAGTGGEEASGLMARENFANNQGSSRYAERKRSEGRSVTSAENRVLISPIELRPARNGIWSVLLSSFY